VPLPETCLRLQQSNTSKLQYEASDIGRVRAAIKERTQSLGMEKSQVSAEAIEDAQKKAESSRASQEQGEMAQLLDLTQISNAAPRGPDEDIPAMFYDVEDDMTEEEMKEADPDGYKSIPEQVLKEVGAAEWPTPGAALREVVVLILSIVLSAVVIVNWDSFLRETYVNYGLLPRPEDIMGGSEDLVLPEGWMNNMSEAFWHNVDTPII